MSPSSTTFLVIIESTVRMMIQAVAFEISPAAFGYGFSSHYDMKTHII